MSFRFDRMSVLIVDDNRHMLNLITEILHGLGIRDIQTSLDAVTAFKEIELLHPDIIISDEAMEPITGVEFTRMLRTSADSPDIHVPVIMVTGYCDNTTVNEARDAGVTEFLAKPISAKSLYLRLLEVINNPRPFVRSRTFIGPDRHRHKESKFDGAERRGDLPQDTRATGVLNADEVEALMQG